MRGRLPSPPFPGQTVGGRRPRRPAKPPANGHPPGSHPRRGQDPSPTDRTIDGCPRNPPGRACPAPTARRPGNGCPRKPHSVSISPSVGRGAPTSPRPPAAAHSRANRRGRRPRRPAKPPANGHPPGSHPRRGQDPSPTDRTIDGCPRNPPGRACPAPTARRPGNGCPRKPHSVSISPSVGRGAPTPPRPSATAHSRATRRGRRPRRPAEACADALPRVTTRGDSRCRQPPRRGQDPSLQAEPLTSAHVTPRAGHARPLPRNNPTNLYTT